MFHIHSYNCCNCFLQGRSGLRFEVGKYSVPQGALFTETLPLDGKMYVCKICD